MTNEQLVLRIRAGEDEAENMLQLWEQNQRFVSSIAVKFSGYAEMDDLKQEGYIALCNAARHYDPDQGSTFIHYAAFWIKQGMQRYIENCCGAVRVPVGVQAEIRKYKKVCSSFQKQYGREASDRELCGLLCMNGEKLGQLKKDAEMGQIRSLNEPIRGEDGDITLGDAVASADDLEGVTMQELDAELMKRDLWIAVDELPGKLPSVIRCRFLEGKTLEETGRINGINGINREAVRRQQGRALRELRWSSEGRKYRGYYEEYISASPVCHVGVESFRRTWTSSTEKEALCHAEVDQELDQILNTTLENDT